MSAKCGPRRTATAPALRDYQAAAVEHVQVAWREHTRVFVEMPTGSGKTRVLGELAREVLAGGGRVLAVAHLRELVGQLAQALTAATGVPAGVVMASRDEPAGRLVVGSVQSLTPARLAGVLAAGPVAMLAVDEAHHATGQNRYAALVDAVESASSGLRTVGVTATPYRADKARMQEVFPVCAFARSVAAMQAAGVLCEMRWRPIRLPGLDLSRVATGRLGGEVDYADAPLGALLASPRMLAATVAATTPLLGRRPALAFGATVAHAQALAGAYAAAGVPAAAVWGEMPPKDRAAVLAAWRVGTVQLVANCGVLVEGFDFPGIAALVMARPTRSPGRYVQMLGRGTRVHPGKADLLVVDVAGGPGLVDVETVTLPAVLGVHPQAVGKGDEQLAEVGEEGRPRWLLDPAGRSRSAWYPEPGSGVYLVGLDSGAVALIPDGHGSGLYAVMQLTFGGDGRVSPLTSRLLPLREAVGAADLALARAGLLGALNERDRAWRHRMPSRKQLAFLGRLDPAVAAEAVAGAWDRGRVQVALTVLLARPLLERARAAL